MTTLTEVCAHLEQLQHDANNSAMVAHHARMQAAAARGKPNHEGLRNWANEMTKNAAAWNRHYETMRAKVGALLMAHPAANDEPLPFDGDVA